MPRATRWPTSLLLSCGCLSRYVRVPSKPPRGFRIVVALTSAGGPSNPRFAQIRSSTLHRPTSSSTYYLHHTRFSSRRTGPQRQPVPPPCPSRGQPSRTRHLPTGTPARVRPVGETFVATTRTWMSTIVWCRRTLWRCRARFQRLNPTCRTARIWLEGVDLISADRIQAQ